MFWINFKRIARSGFMNFWRNGTVSLASVSMMTVTLLVIGAIFFGSAVLNTSLNALRDKVDITVTFYPEASEEDILSIKRSIEALPETSLVIYKTAAEALEEFKVRHASDQSILAALDELNENPLGASLDVKAKDPSQYQGIADLISDDSALGGSGSGLIEHVNYYQNKVAIDKLSEIINTADRLGLLVALSFIGLSILVAFNTIRLTIYIVREELNVMRLVGGSTSYIQGPFLIVGMIYGIVGTIVALLLFLPITYWLGGETQGFFVGLNLFQYYISSFIKIFFLLLLSGIFVGAVSALLAIRRDLRV